MSLATIHHDQPVALSLIPTLISELQCWVAAGFASSAQDHAVQRVDLMAQLIKPPQATILQRVRGESEKDAGIFDNDVVLVDRAITARSGRIVITMVDGDFVCKTLWQRSEHMKLKASNVTGRDW